MSTTTTTTKQGRHVAPRSFDAERQEHLARLGRIVRVVTGRHVACVAAAYDIPGAVRRCTLGLAHVGTAHVYGPARPIVADLAADWTPTEHATATARARALLGGAL